MGQHLHGVVQFEIHGRGIAAVTTAFLLALMGRIGGEPGLMAADVRQDGECGVHVSGCTPRPGTKQGAVVRGSVAPLLLPSAPELSAGLTPGGGLLGGLGHTGVHDGLADGAQGQGRQLDVLPGEGDADDGHGAGQG